LGLGPVAPGISVHNTLMKLAFGVRNPTYGTRSWWLTPNRLRPTFDNPAFPGVFATHMALHEEVLAEPLRTDRPRQFIIRTDMGFTVQPMWWLIQFRI